MRAGDSMPDEPKRTAKPYTMAGAGPLVSSVWKRGDEQAGWDFRFNIYSMMPNTGRVSQLFKAADIVHLAKLCRVLAIVLLDDGCISSQLRSELERLTDLLDFNSPEDQ
jgi:hypothetical protein